MFGPVFYVCHMAILYNSIFFTCPVTYQQHAVTVIAITWNRIHSVFVWLLYTCSNVSIESWILPMVYAGHISAVAWLTPPWTNHSFEPESNFHVGKDAENQQIR